MVRETTETFEVEKSVAVADRVSETIYFDGETMAVSGRFNEDEYTADIDAFDAALNAIDVGVKSVKVNEHITIIADARHLSTFYVSVKYKGGSGWLFTSLEELRKALDRSRSL